MKTREVVEGVLVLLFVSALLLLVQDQATKRHQREIQKRALRLEHKRCYDWQDIETIIFGEIQE